MLSLLVFIGEGLRDAFDPRHIQASSGAIQAGATHDERRHTDSAEASR